MRWGKKRQVLDGNKNKKLTVTIQVKKIIHGENS